jgi:hypothetical protein
VSDGSPQSPEEEKKEEVSDEDLPQTPPQARLKQESIVYDNLDQIPEEF